MLLVLLKNDSSKPLEFWENIRNFIEMLMTLCKKTAKFYFEIFIFETAGPVVGKVISDVKNIVWMVKRQQKFG